MLNSIKIAGQVRDQALQPAAQKTSLGERAEPGPAIIKRATENEVIETQLPIKSSRWHQKA